MCKHTNLKQQFPFYKISAIKVKINGIKCFRTLLLDIEGINTSSLKV